MGRLSRLFGGFRSSRKSEESPAESRATVFEWVVVGLGNPGKEYAGSRHNIGYMVVDRLADRKKAQFGRRRFSGVTAGTELSDRRTLLVKPETYYNNSGECVSALLGYFKIPPERLVVVHDELDLEPGRIRIKIGGGDAGNRGVRSISQSLGTPEFIRVRIGVGKPPADDHDHQYILRPLHRQESTELAAVLDRAAEAVEAIVGEGLSRAMSRYNQRA